MLLVLILVCYPLFSLLADFGRYHALFTAIVSTSLIIKIKIYKFLKKDYVSKILL
jgi:hypothetical protein